MFPFTKDLRRTLEAQRKLTEGLDSTFVFCHLGGVRKGKRRRGDDPRSRDQDEPRSEDAANDFGKKCAAGCRDESSGIPSTAIQFWFGESERADDAQR
jgi:hypothetical protein